MSKFPIYIEKKGKFPLLIKNFPQNQIKIHRKTLHLYGAFCFKMYARTTVSCNVITKTENGHHNLNKFKNVQT